MIFSHMKKEMKSYCFLFQHVCVECQTQLGHLETIIVACQVGTHLMTKYVTITIFLTVACGMESHIQYDI